ncbi:MAG: hypothetical protein LT106_06645 [Burkholderiaceae bacterium]|nr:hypothetical protein [Burkholderiaceae bacterium]
MRTTVTIDPDVEVLIERAVRQSGRPFKQVLNDALRLGLRRAAREEGHARRNARQPVFDMGQPSVDLTKANLVASMLEDEELIERMRRGR